MTKNTLAYSFCALLVGFGAFHQQAPPRIYSVSHTEAEWAQIIAGQHEVQAKIRQSDLPAYEAFYCDSVLNAQQADIYQQFWAQKKVEADTLKNKGGKP